VIPGSFMFCPAWSTGRFPLFAAFKCAGWILSTRDAWPSFLFPDESGFADRRALL
jgi:hypothetical protein